MSVGSMANELQNSWPDRVWQRIHIDFTGPIMGQMLLIVVDAQSKWVEAILMTSTTSEKTIGVLRDLFARYGLLEQIISDNGPQFTSEEFETLTTSNGIRHIRSPPYRPSTNGEAERFVQTVKRKLKSIRNGKMPLSWLQSYWD